MYFALRSSALSTVVGLGLSPASSPALSPSGAASISPPPSGAASSSESAAAREEESEAVDAFVVNMSFQNETVS